MRTEREGRAPRYGDILIQFVWKRKWDQFALRPGVGTSVVFRDHRYNPAMRGGVAAAVAFAALLVSVPEAGAN